MKFQFPQFIDSRTKVIGPLTLPQFLYVGSGLALVFILQFLVSGTVFFIAIIVIMGISSLLAFLKIEGTSLSNYLLTAVGFTLSKKKYYFDKSRLKDPTLSNFGGFGETNSNGQEKK